MDGMAQELPETPREVAERAASVLGPESDLFEDMDAAGFGDALTKAFRSSLADPMVPARAAGQLATDLARIPLVAGRTLVRQRDRATGTGGPQGPAVRRPRLGHQPGLLLGAPGLPGGVPRSPGRRSDRPPLEADAGRKAVMALDLLLDALAPTNFLPTNPAALKRAFDTGGASLVKGARTFVDDLVNNEGKPRQVDTQRVRGRRQPRGTPSKVVYHNDLMELLQYEPQTEQVHATPLLCSPPWINKYYVMDLAPERSFIEWAVRHGRTVFAISYKNPSKEMSGTTMDDYLVHGPQTALDVIEEITGAETIDIVGLCLGGALTAITAAYLTQGGDSRIGTLTLLNTMLDYAEPGALGTFTDLRTVEKLEKKMRKEGALEGELDGRHVRHPAGQRPDLQLRRVQLADGPGPARVRHPRLERRQHPDAGGHARVLPAQLLRREQAGRRDDWRSAGRTIDLSAIKAPTYVVSAINDHIVPWESAYKTVGLVSGPVRFVLGSGGHIAGIVSPPGPKAWHLVTDSESALPPTGAAVARRGRAQGRFVVGGLGASGRTRTPARMQKPPAMGSKKHPVLGDGPGTYVRT